MGRNVKNIKRPDYYPAQHLVFDTLKVEILDCWRKLLGEKDLDQYFTSNPMAIEDLLKHAQILLERYCSTAAYMQALYPDQSLQEFFGVGKPWTQHDEGNQSVVEGDQWQTEIGRAMNVMAVWVFTFAGSGRHKYTNELLELTCNFEFEYSPELCKAILNNWLCNLSGIDGCWFPMDLLMEKLIRQLKKMSERSDATFGGKFYRDVVSRNVRALLDTMAAMLEAIGLAEHGGTHHRRTLGHVARDDWAAGDIRLGDGKRIKEYIERTLRDAGNIHGDEESSAKLEHDEYDPEQLILLPNMLINGELVAGDEVHGDHEVTDQEKELLEFICSGEDLGLGFPDSDEE
ncbi:hypothetical protein EWM64_g7330 [Hericium alpestre]|uniref:DUF6589 domain-containing protein n=1 Tax=Hericium alpestre TaxID=135208 RepID=A0A4Y9ZR19_9AGAM|nr:hypothetical protein EWM64_g7330 [Hericium alpestre]